MLLHQMYFLGWRTDDLTFRGGDDGCEGRVGGSERY